MSIDDLYKQFSDVHPNIVLKTDLLRLGLNIGKAAMENFQQRDDLHWKGFHLFSYDSAKTVVYKEKVPFNLHLEDGCPVMVRTNPNSPYLLDFTGGEFVIRENNEIIARKLWFERKPRWYDMRTKDGIQMGAIADAQIRLIFVTMYRYCELWKTGDQCLFCDINTTLRNRKAGGEDVTAGLDPKVIAEVVHTAHVVDRHFSVVQLSAGTILTKYKGQTELEFYITRLNAVREEFQVLLPTTVQIAAQDDEGWKRLHETGVGSVQPNIEVWDKKLFKWICPGKNKFIGYDEWIRRTISAVNFWGPARVSPNFVLGVEMAKPHGFEDVSSAVKSTAGGWDFLMSHGVLPRYNTWTREGGSAFADQPASPLEFLIEAQKAYAELRWKYNFYPPFPSAGTRDSYGISCLQDFEYYHGNSILSKQNLEARMGVKPGEKGCREDQEGFTCSPA